MKGKWDRKLAGIIRQLDNEPDETQPVVVPFLYDEARRAAACGDDERARTYRWRAYAQVEYILSAATYHKLREKAREAECLKLEVETLRGLTKMIIAMESELVEAVTPARKAAIRQNLIRSWAVLKEQLGLRQNGEPR